jgi:hypothetical protein
MDSNVFFAVFGVFVGCRISRQNFVSFIFFRLHRCCFFFLVFASDFLLHGFFLFLFLFFFKKKVFKVFFLSIEASIKHKYHVSC